MKKPLFNLIRAFFLFLLFTIIRIDVFAQENVTFSKGGYINQGGIKGIQLGTNISKDYYYWTHSFTLVTSGLFQNGDFYISPRAGYEFQVTILAAAAEFAYYRGQIYFVPQIGLTLFSGVDILFGYNARLGNKNNQIEATKFFLSTTINISVNDRASAKP